MGIFPSLSINLTLTTLFPTSVVLLNIILFILILRQGTHSRVNRWFLLAQAVVILLSAVEYLAGHGGGTAYTVRSLWAIDISITAFLQTILLVWALVYTNHNWLIDTSLKRLLIFVPALCMFLLSWATDLIIDHRGILNANDIREGIIQSHGPLYILVIITIVTYTAIICWLLLDYRKSLTDPKKRKQTGLFIAGYLGTAFLFSTIKPLASIFPSFASTSNGIALMLPLSVAVTYGIMRYQLFQINPSVLLPNIIRTMNEMLIVVNTDYHIEFVNHSVTKTLEVKQEDLIGQPLSKIIAAPWSKLEQKMFAPLIESPGERNSEVDILTKQNDIIPTNFSVTPYVDEHHALRGFLITLSDIRKLRELLDIASERAKLKIVMDSIQDGVLSLNHDGEVQIANPAALYMLQMSQFDVVGHKLSDILSITSQRKHVPLNKLTPSLVDPTQSDSIILQNVQITSASDHIFWADVNGSAISKAHDIDLQTIITLHDLSEEQHLEEMKSDFVSMAAHELKTPLTSLNGYLDFLRADEPKTFTEEQRLFAERAKISADRLTALVLSLLDVSKIENHKIAYTFESVNWPELVSEEVEGLQTQADEKGLKLSFEPLKGNTPLVDADPVRIKEVLMNLIGNAISYTPKGTIRVWLEMNDEMVTTNITDTGNGISEKDVKQLFTKFFRVNKKLLQNSQGTGLGLYISKKIVEDHHGSIWVESVLSQGSTFSFSLPLTKA